MSEVSHYCVVEFIRVAESEQSFRFLVRKPSEGPPPPFPPYLTNHHTSFLMGIRVTKSELGELMSGSSTNFDMVSGYQALRLATELFPTTMALLGAQGLSPFWTILFYFTVILFGIAQQVRGDEMINYYNLILY